MANELDQLNLNQAGTLPPELFAQQQQLNRQQQMANMLMQNNQQPQGQMISGRYVAPSWTQQLAPVANMLAGAYIAKQGDTKAAELAQALREGRSKEQQAIMEKLNAGDNKGALALASGSTYGGGKEFVPALIGSVIPKTPEKVAEYNLAKQEGFKGSFNDFANQITPYQKQSLALQAAGQNKPQIIETANGYVAVNPNNPSQATPVMFNGQAVTGSKGALTGEGAKQVTGATNLKSAIDDYQAKLKNFGTLDMVNPNARADMGQAYNTMMLQAKEAFNLGVLNGKDWEILQKVVTDPTSPNALLLSKNTMNKQSEELAKTANNAIKNVYEVHQKPIPTNMQMPATNPASANPTPQIDPKLLQFMTPEQRKLFGG